MKRSLLIASLLAVAAAQAAQRQPPGTKGTVAPTQDPAAARRAAEAFAREHLAACCADLRKWQVHDVLEDGKLKELALLCASFSENDDELHNAESIVIRTALEACSTTAKNSLTTGRPSEPGWTDPDHRD